MSGKKSDRRISPRPIITLTTTALSSISAWRLTDEEAACPQACRLCQVACHEHQRHQGRRGLCSHLLAAPCETLLNDRHPYGHGVRVQTQRLPAAPLAAPAATNQAA